MFEMTVAPGAFVVPGRLVIYKVSQDYVIFFFVYVWGVTFAVVRVISAIFLKETMAVAAQDKENAIAERMKKKDKDIQHLRRLFTDMDTDNLGHVSLDQFNR